MDLIMSSLTLQPNLFQLFQPIGGVSAAPLSHAAGLAEHNAKENVNAKSEEIVVRNILRFMTASGILRGGMIQDLFRIVHGE
jgi:hypothetical protein